MQGDSGAWLGVAYQCLFGDYQHHVALNWFYADSSKPKPAGHGGLNHFAIVYPDELSLAQAVARLLQHGDLVDDARDHGGIVSVYLRDPDANGIELYYDRPRSQWFDATGQLIIKSEPFNVRKWLKHVLDDSCEVSCPLCVLSFWRCSNDRTDDAVSTDVDIVVRAAQFDHTSQ